MRRTPGSRRAEDIYLDRGFFLTLQALRRQLAAMPYDLYLIRLIHHSTRRAFPGERLWTADQLTKESVIRVAQGAETDSEDQDVCGNQRQCGSDASMDGVDRDAGIEVPTIEIKVCLVVVDSGGFAATTIVLLAGSVGLAERSISGSTGAGRRA